LTFIHKRKYKFGKNDELHKGGPKCVLNLPNELKFRPENFENLPKIFWNYE